MMGIESSARRSFGTPISVSLRAVRESDAAKPICGEEGGKKKKKKLKSTTVTATAYSTQVTYRDKEFSCHHPSNTLLHQLRGTTTGQTI